MSEKYVSRVLLEINGQKIDDFANVEEGEVEIAAPVKLMNTTGHIDKLARQGVKLDYVVPSDGPEFDFTKVKGGTITIDYQNGKRVKYTGVYTTKIGALKHDGEKESTKTIEFSAKKKS